MKSLQERGAAVQDFMSSIIDQFLFVLNVFRQRHLAKEILITILGQLIGVSALFVGLKVLTSILGAEEFGEYSLGMAAAGIIGLFVYGPISQATLRLCSKSTGETDIATLFKFVSMQQKKVAFRLFVLSIFSLPGIIYFAPKNPVLYLISILISVISSGYVSTGISFFLANRNRSAVATLQAVSIIFPTAAAVVLTRVLNGGGASAFAGYSLGNAMAAVAIWRHVRMMFNPSSMGNDRIDEFMGSGLSERFHNFAKPFVLFALFGSMVSYGDRWLVQLIFDKSLVGVYAAMFVIANTPMTILGSFVTQLTLPIIYSKSDSSRHPADVRRVHQWTVLSAGFVLSFAAFFIACFGEEILAVATTDEFTPFHKGLGIMAIGCALFQFAQIRVIKGMAKYRPEIYVFPKFVHAITFILLLLVIGNRYSLMGVGFAYIASSVAYLVAVEYSGRRLEIY